MIIKSAKIAAINSNRVDIKINTGFREFIVEISKGNITRDDIENNEVDVRVYSMVRNCCSACPIYVLESGKNEKEDNEIGDLLMQILKIVGKELML